MMTPSLLSALVVASTCPTRITAAASAHYEQADAKAALAATASLEACADGTPTELADALRWRAQAQLAESNPSAALDAFVLLATIDPRYQLDPLLSPKLHQLHIEARARVATEGTPFARLRRAPLDGSKVLVEVFDPRGLAKRVLVRFQGSGRPAEVSAATRMPGDSHPSRWEASVPVGAGQEVSALVFDDAGTVARTATATLAELSEPGLPRAVAVATPLTEPMPTGTKVALGVTAAVAVIASVAVIAWAAGRAESAPGWLDLP